jgi:predicted transcriptional regulator
MTMYSPSIADEYIRKLYRLARVRGVPMTRLVDEIVAEYLTRNKQELASYDPSLHDRRPSKLQRAA